MWRTKMHLLRWRRLRVEDKHPSIVALWLFHCLLHGIGTRLRVHHFVLLSPTEHAAMTRAVKKFLSKHKFGKQTKRSLAENFKKCSTTTEDAQDDGCAVLGDAVAKPAKPPTVNLTIAGPANPSAAKSTADIGRVRHNAQILQALQL